MGTRKHPTTAMTPYFKNITIIGVGLIGGSFARACKKKGITGQITGFGRGTANLQKGVELGVIDRYSTDLKESVLDADLIFLAPPVESVISIAHEIADMLKPGAIVTDAGSVKGDIVASIEKKMPENIYFVGGHPIAGTEKGGVEASFDTLFENAICVLTPTPETNPNAFSKVKTLWQTIGSEVMEMNTQEHDLVLAAISHLPHIVAYALVNAVADSNTNSDNVTKLAAGGFKDITRIASSHPVLWREICIMNREQILALIKQFKVSLLEIENFLTKKDEKGLENSFFKAKKFRDLI